MKGFGPAKLERYGDDLLAMLTPAVTRHADTIPRLGLRRSIGVPRRRGRIRKLRLFAVLVVLMLLALVAFSFGLVRAVGSEIPTLDPARQRSSNQVDSVIYAVAPAIPATSACWQSCAEVRAGCC